jgi:trimethylamine---corrinoid protein Co-methyltransferase
MMMTSDFRQGTVVRPYERLDAAQIECLHQASLAILQEPGIWCYSLRAADLFAAAGARVREHSEHGQPVWRISLPAGLVQEAVAMAPSRFVSGRSRT